MENDDFIRLLLFILITCNLALNIVGLSIQLDKNSKISKLENETAYLKTKISDLENKSNYIDNTVRNYDRGPGNERNQELVWIYEDESTVKGFVTQIQDCPNSMPTTQISTPNKLTNDEIYGCDVLINGTWVKNLTWAECERLRGR